MFESLTRFMQELFRTIVRPIETIASAQNELVSQIYSMLTGRNNRLENLNRDLDKTNKSIEEKIDEAQQALITTSKVFNELNNLIDTNQNELQRVKSEYERINELNDISLEQAKPLLEALDSSVKQNNKKNMWINFVVSLVLFLAGAIFGPFIYDFYTSLF